VAQTADEQLELLRRGVEAIVPTDELRKKLELSVATGKPLRVKYGIDPTGIDVHLGHTVPLRKLRQFQDLGHTAVIIIGNYTALVGDPSGRDETRAKLTQDQVESNARDYLLQIGRIIDLNRAEVHRNGDWFSKWSFLDVLDLTRRMTLSQLSAREDFAKRLAEAKPVHLHECLYPLMQGWDSVEIRADVELGGTEQLFSLLVGRDFQEAEGQPPQTVLTMPILVGTDGVRRMGKSLGNYIGVGDQPEMQFGKIMSIPDEPMRQYFTLLTEVPFDEVERQLTPGVNPRDAKEVLARNIVSQYWGEAAAESAAAEFRKRAKREDPDEIPDVDVSLSGLGADGSKPLAKLLVEDLHFESSTSNARRVIEQGGVTIGPDRELITDPKTTFRVDKPGALIHFDTVEKKDSIIIKEQDFIVRRGNRKIARVRLVP
jgi:tyrosyl-tRNA synthetase